MIKFAHNEYFILLLLLVVFIAYFIVYRSWVKKAWAKFGDKSVIESLMPEVSTSKSVFKFILVLFATLFLIVGIIDPQIGSKLEKIKREGIDLYLVLDVSNSMLSNNKKSSSSSSNRGTNCVIGRTNPTFGTTTMNCR